MLNSDLKLCVSFFRVYLYVELRKRVHILREFSSLFLNSCEDFKETQEKIGTGKLSPLVVDLMIGVPGTRSNLTSNGVQVRKPWSRNGNVSRRSSTEVQTSLLFETTMSVIRVGGRVEGQRRLRQQKRGYLQDPKSTQGCVR